MPAAQLGDRLFQIGLFADQRVVFFLHLCGVFLGAQVHRAQRVALAFQPVHLGLDLLGGGHLVGVAVQLVQQVLPASSPAPP